MSSRPRPKRAWRTRIKRGLVIVRRRVPPGLRLLVGLLLVGGGLLGFLPVLGFWMIPLGIAVAALDVIPLWRAVTGQKHHRPGAGHENTQASRNGSASGK